MGCGASKIDGSPLVSLCRERKYLIRDAADLRYALAASHANYLRSLAGVGDAIHDFVREELVAAPSPPSSPVITHALSKSKSETDGSVTPLSHSLSAESHIHLSSESESEKSLKSSPQIGAPSAVQSPNYHFMRSSTGIPSMVYQNPYAWDYPYNYSMSSLPRDPAIEITPPPPPPPPAGGSAWDFFDPFNSYEQFLPQEKYYVIGSGSSSTNSSEVREREGIPDLEEETEQEILKSAKKEKTQMRITDEDLKRKDFGEGTSKAIPEDEKDAEGTIRLEREKESTSVSESSKERSFKEEGGQTKDKGVVLEERSMVTEESGPSNAAARGTKDVVEVVKEINELFKSATACGEEISRMLEVGKVNYRARSRIFRVVSSRILEPLGLCMLTSSQPFKHSQKSATNATKSRGKAAPSEHHFGMKSGNISSTLEKLYMWERKLYKEVKGEEKLRVIYEKKCRRLRYLDNRGAVSHKIDSTRASIRRLQTKLSIVIKSVDAISSRMHKIRDDELQPQLVELIKGLIRMWKSFLECHQKQFQAILNSKSHNLMAKMGVHGNTVANITRELEVQLVNWCSSFHDWINTQKSYVEALNGWLMKWLPHEEEETPDGVVPFSPSRIEAPAVFVVSNDWNNALRRVSEAEVMTAMHNFAVNVHKLWESQEEEQRQKLKAEYLSRDYARRLDAFQNDSGMPRNLDIVSVTDNGQVYHDEMLELMRRRLDEERTKHEAIVKQIQEAASTSLKTGLLPIFEALGDFTSETVKVYEEVRIPKEGDGGP